MTWHCARAIRAMKKGGVCGRGVPAMVEVMESRVLLSVSFVLDKSGLGFPYTAYLARNWDFNRDGQSDSAIDINTGDDKGVVKITVSDGDFGSRNMPDIPIDGEVRALQAGDFNKDGKLDLAEAFTRSGVNAVKVLLGNGDGTFRLKGNYSTGYKPTGLAVGDYNRDGKLDLATSNEHGNSVSVLLGNGDGTFKANRDFAAGSQPRDVASGDVNKDGKLDLITANQGSNSVSVLLGNGDGTFGAKQDFRVGYMPQMLAAADINSDGKVDLATENDDGSVSVLLNTTAPAKYAPSDAKISPSTVAENQPSGTTVGTLSATDPNSGDTFTYSLVGGTAVPDNAKFTISGNQLKTAASFNYEAKKSYSIRVRVRDNSGLYLDKALVVNVGNVNETPTSVGISARTVAEHKAVGTVVGTLSASDPDAGTVFTYSLSNGTTLLAADNAAFKLVKTSTGTQLQTNASINYETKKTYNLIIRAKDQGGKFCDKPITVSVSNINETPTGIVVTPATVLENKAAGTVVGTLSTMDPDLGNSFTYSMVTGTGGTDNAAFSIVGNQLKTTRSFNYESKKSYSIRVRSKDQGGLFCDRVIAISVGDVNERPTGITLTTPGSATPTVPQDAAAGATVGTFGATDPDAGSTFGYALIDGAGSADNSKFTISGNQLLVGADALTLPAGQTYSILVRVTDQGTLSYDKAFTLTVAA